MKTWLALFSICILPMLLLITTHELTHIALNNWHTEGLCILNCTPEKNGFVNPVGVYLGKNPTPLSQQEDIPDNVGLFVGVLTWIVAVFVNTNLYKKLEHYINYVFKKNNPNKNIHL